MKDTKRTLEELVMRYRLHPNLCDVYVEGETDRRLVQWFLQANKRKAIVYRISDVDVGKEVLVDAGLQDSNRDRVIFLARRLEDTLGVQLRVVCIADADCDRFMGISHTESFLLITDYTSIEMYGFDPGRVRKALYLFGCNSEMSGGEVLAAITPLLKKLFLHRVVSQLLNYNLHWISASRCCTLVGSNIDFNVVEFQNRYFNTRGLNLGQKHSFGSRLAELEHIACTDDRQCIRGHDFVEVLAWYFGKCFRRSPTPDADELTRVLFATLSVADLAAEALFSSLLSRTADCA